MRRNTRKSLGVVLIEILIIVAMIGIIAGILMPNLLDGLNKAKQKRTVGDIHGVAIAMMSYHIDMYGAAAAGFEVDLREFDPIDHQDLTKLLIPHYLKYLPTDDAWGHPFDYYYGRTTTESGWQLAFGVRSRGRDGIAEGFAYTWGSFPPTDYDRDIVWLDGVFVTWPGWIEGDVVGASGSGCNQGVGNGQEGCDPGNSNNNQDSNDEPSSPTPSPGDPGRKGGKGGK